MKNMLYKTTFPAVLFTFLFAIQLHAQGVQLQGYVFEENNRGYLYGAKVTINNSSTGQIVNTVFSDVEGIFKADLMPDQDYGLIIEKDAFEKTTASVSTRGNRPGEKIFTKIQMTRQPGYIFDVTLAEEREDNAPIDAISEALIEVYNNTIHRQELTLENHPNPFFKFNFIPGNHYTVMIRKSGFFTKRIEAYVNINGCILCIDGVSEMRPGVTDNLTSGFQQGTVLANIELKRIRMDKAIRVDNIYYDYDKWDIRKDAAKELDKLVQLLKDNPQVQVELGSHTDSRGSSGYNKDLSQKRAQSAVDYIVKKGNISKARISAVGYGEAKLVNRCADGVNCTDAQHAQNRRTELKVLGIIEGNELGNKSLAEIIEGDDYEARLLAELEGSEIQIPADGNIPPDLAEQLEQKAAVKEQTAPVPQTEAFSLEPETMATEPAKSIPESYFEPAAAIPAPVAPEMPPVSTVAVPRTGEVVISPQVASDNPSKPVPSDFSGFSVEFFTATTPLTADHPIFFRHGNIQYQQLADGTFAYYLGKYKTHLEAERFLSEIIQARYPEASVVEFNKGSRVQ